MLCTCSLSCSVCNCHQQSLASYSCNMILRKSFGWMNTFASACSFQFAILTSSHLLVIPPPQPPNPQPLPLPNPVTLSVHLSACHLFPEDILLNSMQPNLLLLCYDIDKIIWSNEIPLLPLVICQVCCSFVSLFNFVVYFLFLISFFLSFFLSHFFSNTFVICN